MPTAIKFASILFPPKLIKGSGTPVVGISPKLTAMLRIAQEAIPRVSPKPSILEI